ncbi:hypothetical protein R3P38DRAFT_2921062 [Favolaschia claudopus]|uniref:Uncharacterized protein n=1 Tax=Favolaschia claudopus TaxID=2862362 RepID=A0AAW0C2F8_9AGAR
MSTTAAFFYGTLMHPKILKKIIENDGSHLQICQAVLLNFTRHEIKFEDYPGLTASDLEKLDEWEDAEYERQKVVVHPLEDLVYLPDYEMPTIKPSALPSDSDLPGAVEVETYVYTDLSNLNADVWNFDDFVDKNAWKWYDPERAFTATDGPSEGV